jgi:hypothetical protein
MCKLQELYNSQLIADRNNEIVAKISIKACIEREKTTLSPRFTARLETHMNKMKGVL